MRLLKTIAVSLFLTLMGGLSLLAQNRTVTGTVVDEQGLPIIGAAIIINGTATGTVTDPDGTFSLSVPQGTVVFNVSCIGYETLNVPVTGTQGVVNIVMKEDSMLLEETVVVGYGTQKKVNLTGAISVIDDDALKNRPTTSVTNMLQGSVAGLNISRSSGVPGESGSMNIRGFTSINSADPIVLIDGAIGDLDRVNPNDVASISVIKDAAAAAVYGARAAYGVILVTTKSGAEDDSKATIRYSGRVGWETPTTSTDYETTGYWTAQIVNTFWSATNGGLYLNYSDYDMGQLLARVNDKTENPDRPWVVTETVNGREQWKYYGNTDWYHALYNDVKPMTQHNISISGGNKAVKYYLSGGYEAQRGVIKVNPDRYNKYNMRSKIDVKLAKWAKLTNNTSFYSSTYNYNGVGSVENAFAYGARHALACFPLTNPDGTWVYSTPYTSYKVANGRHAIYGNGYNVNIHRKSDFANTTELVITPIKPLSITANFTYRLHQNRNTNRSTNFYYREYPNAELGVYNSGAGENSLTESVDTWSYKAANVFATYKDTFASAHNLTVMAGFNYETQYRKDLEAYGKNLISDELSDLDLVVPNADGVLETAVYGGQSEYALAGFFGRINYDYKGRYLVELSGRYDGTSRFAKGSRWGMFPSVSAGWRISEENFFASAKKTVDNLKIRASYGSLGNQNVGYYDYIRTISIKDFSAYYFNEGSSMGKYAQISSPNSPDLTWETSYQYNVGIDLSMFGNRLDATLEGYIRDTKDMLTTGKALPSIYGATEPKTNSADLRTSGFEISLGWRDQFDIAGRPFGYNIRGTLSEYKSVITKFDNPNKTFAMDYYEGMEIGEIWGFVVNDLFATDEEALEYTSRVDQSYCGANLKGGWMAGDLKYEDLPTIDTDGDGIPDTGDGVISIGSNTVDNPGDMKILGNYLPSLQYGINIGFDYAGFDVSAFFQGTGNHYWYSAPLFFGFWGPYSYAYNSFIPKNYMDNVWSEDNPDAYFPRPRSNQASNSTAQLGRINSRYLQNLRYLRFKNLTVGYSLPEKIVKAAHLQSVRFYFSGENLCYWSPLKKVTKYLDPEAAYKYSAWSETYGVDGDNKDMAGGYYPWQKTFTFGIDITF